MINAVVSWFALARFAARRALEQGVVLLVVGVVAVVVLGSGTCNWKSPGCSGQMNGGAFGMLLYCYSVRTSAQYPSCTPPSVVGTHWAFRLICRLRTKSESNVGSPSIFESSLYSKCEYMFLME